MRITVITAACNAAATIADTIASVLAQSHRDLQLLIVDDGSTDDTAAVAARFADRRIALIRQPNAGVAAARNRGMAAADGDALLFLDADDWLSGDALARLARTLQAAPEAVAAVGPYARCDASGATARPAAYRPHAAACDLLLRLVVQNQFANGGHVLVRRSAADRAGNFRAGIVYGEDWEFFIRLALQGGFVFDAARQPLLFVRVRAEGAFRRLAADPAAFAPAMAAIFGNPDLIQRFGPARLVALRRRADAENAWIVGRELVRQDRAGEGRRWLAASVAAAPSPRRVGLLAAAYALPLLPPSWHGPFRSYTKPP